MREELKKLKAINSEKACLSIHVDQVQEILEFLQDIRVDAAEPLRCKLRMLILRDSERIEALENQRREIIDITSTLSEKQRKVLLLHYDGGLSWADISRAMGYSLRYIYKIVEDVT